MSVAAYINAEGLVLSTILIFNGVIKNPGFTNGLPVRSKIYMNLESFFISSKLFSQWLKVHFFQKKPPGSSLMVIQRMGILCKCWTMQLRMT